jgi:ubiquinone/menaquinone biosynthesis C-methylase UbiE
MDKSQKFWNGHARKFDSIDKQFEQANQQIIDLTKEYLNANDNVLDFGCATGNKTIKLAGGVKHIHGLDFSAEMIKEAIKKKNELNIENVSFSQGVIFNNELEKSSFEKIIAYSIIHLLEDSENVIQRIHELLKPGGLFISETACFRDKMNNKTKLEVTAFHFMKKLGIFPLHLNIWKTSDLEQIIKSKNFNIVISRNFFYNGMTISFIVAEKL